LEENLRKEEDFMVQNEESLRNKEKRNSFLKAHSRNFLSSKL
jgi:hypothetical protein